MSTDFRDSAEGQPAVTESKRDRFTRIAAKRTQHVLERVRILGNCSNRSVYEYTADDIDKIFAAIEEELQDTRRRFKDRKRRTDEFKF